MFCASIHSPALLAFIIVYSTFTQSGGSLSGSLQQHGSRLPLRGPQSDLVPNPSEPTPPPLPPPPTKVSDYYGPHLVSGTVSFEPPTPLTPVFSPSATSGTTTNLPSWALLPMIPVLLGIFGICVAYVRLFGGRRSSQQRTSFGITVSVLSYLSRQFAVVSKFFAHVIMMVCFVYGAVQIVSDVTGQPSPSTLLRIVVSKLSLGVDCASSMKIVVRLTDLKQSASSVDELHKLFVSATESVLLAIPQWYQQRIISRGVFTLSTVKVVGGRMEFAMLDMSDALVLGRVACGACCLIAFMSIIVFVSKAIVTSVSSHKPLGIFQRVRKCFEAMTSPLREVLRSIFTLLPSSIELNFVVPFIIHNVNLLLNAAMVVDIPFTACKQLFSIPFAESLLSALSLAIFVTECAFAAFKDKCESCYERFYQRLLTSVASVRATRIMDKSMLPLPSESVNDSYTETPEDDSVFYTVPDSVDVISPKRAFNLRINTGFVFTPTRNDSDSAGSPTTSTPSAASSYFDSSSASLSGEITPATSISDSSLLLPTAKDDAPGLPAAISPQCEDNIEQSTADTDSTPTRILDTISSISAPKIDDSDLQAPTTGTSQHQETTKQVDERHTRCSANAPLVALVEDDGLGPWTVVEPKRCKRRYRAKFPPVDHFVDEPRTPAPQPSNLDPPAVTSLSSSEESSVSTLMRAFSKLSL
ncbi:hypothetical protein BD410DRAFT_901500 [Rickenella mellea]|uniref:Uncharacterized protein n=1 Tax=Rickenella mellea TaxID=50990 RepID=A0A4Y7PQX0_9AGAM|nr:hypothetical protein BD410DRAFT_901500 [Rickenella mellea]